MLKVFSNRRTYKSLPNTAPPLLSEYLEGKKPIFRILKQDFHAIKHN